MLLAMVHGVTVKEKVNREPVNIHLVSALLKNVELSVTLLWSEKDVNKLKHVTCKNIKTS